MSSHHDEETAPMDNFHRSQDRSVHDPVRAPAVRAGRGVFPRWLFLFTTAIAALVAMLVMGTHGGTVASGERSLQIEVAPTAVALTALATATPRPTGATVPTATSRRLPTATADTIRPLAGPVMPRVVNSGPSPVRRPGTPDPDPTTDHVIVMDGSSGTILFQRNPYEPVAPASLTKIMTAILGIEHGSLSDHVKVDVDAGSMPGSSLMGLEPWFDVTFKDLIYGLILPSGNDAALAIARYVGGDDDVFVGLMNQKAAWLRLKATHFANPHGLDASDHYSSPYDMVVMAQYGMQYPIFRDVVSARTYEVMEENVDFTIPNVNPILDYPGADGVKTGLTDSAGRSVVATAVNNGHRVYVAFMRSKNGVSSDGAMLLNWAFMSYDWPRESGQPPR